MIALSIKQNNYNNCPTYAYDTYTCSKSNKQYAALEGGGGQGGSDPHPPPPIGFALTPSFPSKQKPLSDLSWEENPEFAPDSILSYIYY